MTRSDLVASGGYRQTWYLIEVAELDDEILHLLTRR